MRTEKFPLHGVAGKSVSLARTGVIKARTRLDLLRGKENPGSQVGVCVDGEYLSGWTKDQGIVSIPVRNNLEDKKTFERQWLQEGSA